MEFIIVFSPINILFYIFYAQMKKSLFLLGLLTTTICLSACWSKNFNMSFEDALKSANYSELQDILSQNEIFEQDFKISGKYNADSTKVDANISSNSKQNLNNKNTDSSTKFNANITSSGETIKINWALDIKLLNDTLYLNLASLDMTWSENLAMVGMMTAGFKNQWFSIPMSWLSDMPNTFSIFKDSKDLNNKAKEIIINEGSTTYNWRFSQFNGYNARKISLDNDKLNELIKEYYNTMNGDLNEELSWNVPEMNIQNFEWYLVITSKNKVTTIIEKMQIQDNETILDVEWYAGKDYEIKISESDTPLITLSAKKNLFSKYKISANIADSINLEWTISPKLSTSNINLKFKATLNIKALSEWEPDIIIPFNGSRKYNLISEFTTTAPDNAQDLSEMLSSYLWGMMWWNIESENYENIYSDDTVIDDTEILENSETPESTDTGQLESVEITEE